MNKLNHGIGPEMYKIDYEIENEQFPIRVTRYMKDLSAVMDYVEALRQESDIEEIKVELMQKEPS